MSRRLFSKSSGILLDKDLAGSFSLNIRHLYKRCILGSVFIGLATLAAILLFALWHPPRTEVDPTRFRSENFLLDPDDRLGFKTKPDVMITEIAGTQQFVLHTDGRGARISPGEEETRQADILLVGGSQSLGHGVPNESTFIQKVATCLGKRVVNLSVSGYGGVSALERLRLNLDLRPKVIVCGLWEDHLNRNLNPCTEHNSPVCLERPHIKFDSAGRATIEFPSFSQWNVNMTRRWYMETAKGTEEYRSFLTDVFWTTYQIMAEVEKMVFRGNDTYSMKDKIEAMKVVLLEMKRAAETVGAKLVVVWLPLYFSDTINPPPVELTSFAKKEGILWVSMTARFQVMKRKHIPLAIAGDGHMTEAAHEAVSEELVKVLS